MHSPDVDYIRKVLRAHLALTNVDRRRYPRDFCTADELITSNRYILILRGEIEYEVEGVRTRLKRGHLLFVPAWVRRQWRAVGREGCENIWCEFSSLSLEIDRHSLFYTDQPDMKTELESLERMRDIWRRSNRKPSYFPDLGHAFSAERTEDIIDLQLEGELKASLARFWASALCRDNTRHARHYHPEIRKALLFMEGTFSQHDALSALYGQLALTPNYFRAHFKRQMRMTPSEFLNALRMRYARHLIQHSKRAVKEIAFCVGFKDPLYFSRQYAAFWGTSPRADKRIGA